ncbi:MAG: hypothetical protein NTX48_07110 [Planctomycetales bacterium]|nr:hypothetical protein [Planctomycetales bacterium]
MKIISKYPGDAIQAEPEVRPVQLIILVIWAHPFNYHLVAPRRGGVLIAKSANESHPQDGRLL